MLGQYSIDPFLANNVLFSIAKILLTYTSYSRSADVSVVVLFYRVIPDF